MKLEEHTLWILRKLKNEAVPLFVKKLKEGNPSEFAKWNGNCCRQVASFSHMFLHAHCKDDLRLAVCESVFSGILNGKQIEFDHSWCWATENTNRFKKEGIVIDYSPSHSGFRVAFSETNDVQLTKGVKGVIEKGKRIHISPEIWEKNTEFYTGKLLLELYNEVITEME